MTSMNRMNTLRVPAVNWMEELAAAVRYGIAGDTIIVKTEEQKSLGLIAIQRRGRTDLKIITEQEEAAQ
jgi:hypothetical protein